nr:alpha-amylase [Treponema sp.]
GGDIYTRSEYSLTTQQFNDAIPNEFWREVVDRVAQECPDTLLLAEAFWMMEGYFVRTLGMHRVYNSAFMNMLKKEENQKYRDTIKNTITFDPQVLKRYVNFMNNPDEETAIAQFGDGDKYFGVCTLMITMPGLPMFGHGQIEGFTEKYGMEYTKAYKDEKPSGYLVDRHWHDIFPLMKKRYLFSGVENFLLYDLWEDGHVNENVFAYSNGAGDERTLVFYNNKYDQAHGWIKQSDPYAVHTGNGEETKLVTRSISEGLNLTGEDDKFCIFQEHKSRLWYIRKSKEICEQGMFVMLNGFEYQVYMNIHQVTDCADHRYQILCDYLGGRGCEDIESAWQDLIYKDLYQALGDFTEKALAPIMEAFKVPEEKKLDEAAEKASAKAKKTTSKAKAPAKAKAHKVDLKKITEILNQAEESGLAFYKTAQDFAKAVDKKLVLLTPEKQFKLFKDRIKKCVSIHNAEAKKAPADLQKALSKITSDEEFAKLMITSKKEIEKVLPGWALSAQYADNGLASYWNFGRKLNEFLKLDIRFLFQKTLLLASTCDPEKLPAKQKEEAYKLTQLLVSSPYAAALSGANSFDNIKWFNKEVLEENLNLAIMMMGLSAKTAKLAEVFKFYKVLCAAKLKAAYKCDLFEKAFAPVVKKTVAKKNTAKKTVSKKEPAKAKTKAKKTSSSRTSKK